MRYNKKTGRLYSVPGNNGWKKRVFSRRRQNEYVSVRAIENGIEYEASAHIVIWEFLNGPLPAELEIHHKDAIRYHNRISNLALVTHSQNIIEGIKLHKEEKLLQRKSTILAERTRKFFGL
jgi:hypothetical protein